MASTYTTRLRLEKQATGENDTTWGTRWNTQTGLIEIAISGQESIAVTTTAITLTEVNGAEDTARYAMVILTGTPGADRTLIVPDLQKIYYIYNNTDFVQTVTAGAGTNVALAVGSTKIVYTDGSTNAADMSVEPVWTPSTDITFSNANPEILGNDTDGVTYLSAGASTILGGSVRLYGDTHSTLADDIQFYGSAVLQLHYDDSGSLWDFQANAVTTSGLITGGTVTATNMATLGEITLTAANPEILGGDTNGITYFSGGASTILGGSIRLHGDTETDADDIDFYGSATLQLKYDDSTSIWDFQANDVKSTGNLTFGTAFLIEQANADADVAGNGQIWVKTATPNELWFTDDAGTDFELATVDDVEVSAIAADTTTAYTLVIGDRGQTVTMSNASANVCTIPANAAVAFDVGTVVNIIMKGAGVTSVTADTGVTMNGVSTGSAVINNQYAGVSIIKTATNTWIMSGDHGTVA